MAIRPILEFILSNYRVDDLMSSESQMRLRNAQSEFSGVVSPDFLVRGSGGQGNPSAVPWIAIMDPDETLGPQSGVYLVYLFKADLTGAYLSLAQGVTHLQKSVGSREAAQVMQKVNAGVRGGLGDETLSGLEETIDLRSRSPLPRAYETGTIAAIEYISGNLPTEAVLRSDLARMQDLYLRALPVRDALQDVPMALLRREPQLPEVRAEVFKPKDASDYIQNVKAATLIKTRKHELLVREFGEFAASCLGGQPITSVHPRDLVIRFADEEWLVEAKIIRGINGAQQAARDALGQLIFYRALLYPRSVERLYNVALFDQSIGQAYEDVLLGAGVYSAYFDTGKWRGSALDRRSNTGTLDSR